MASSNVVFVMATWGWVLRVPATLTHTLLCRQLSGFVMLRVVYEPAGKLSKMLLASLVQVEVVTMKLGKVLDSVSM